MSEALENLEKLASEDNITNPDRIGSILNRFLDMKIMKLKGPKCRKNPYLAYITRDISRGFLLDPGKVEECSIRELLTLIGCEPGVPWFEINAAEEAWVAEEKLTRGFSSAGHSFALGQALLMAQPHEPEITRLMKINYREFIQYLANRINASNDNADQMHSRLCLKKGMRLNRIYYETQKFVRDYNNSLENENLDKILTLGGIIELASQRGSQPWICGNEPLGLYVERIVRTYKIMNWIFMNSVREIAISIENGYIKKLLDRYSESGNYENFREIDFESCFCSFDYNPVRLPCQQVYKA